jgi:hypothetical protein
LLCNVQISKLRDKLEAIAKELEAADRDSFLSSIAAEQAAELAALPIRETTKSAKTQDTAQHKAESRGKLKPKDRKPKKQMKPQVNELEEAEKRPKLFEPAAGPPPKIGEEELQAEGSGHEILLQVCSLFPPLFQSVKDCQLCALTKLACTGQVKQSCCSKRCTAEHSIFDCNSM